MTETGALQVQHDDCACDDCWPDLLARAGGRVGVDGDALAALDRAGRLPRNVEDCVAMLAAVDRNETVRAAVRPTVELIADLTSACAAMQNDDGPADGGAQWSAAQHKADLVRTVQKALTAVLDAGVPLAIVLDTVPVPPVFTGGMTFPDYLIGERVTRQGGSYVQIMEASGLSRFTAHTLRKRAAAWDKLMGLA